MHHRRLGRTNLLVSEISLGTVELGLDYGLCPTGDGARPSEAAAARLLHHALDLGINFIDTARLYGVSEEIIGRALHGRRDEFILATKIPLFNDEHLTGAGLRERATAAVHESLAALATDVVDLMMLHSVASVAGVPSEILDVLESFQQQGAIRFLGVSVYGEEQALAAITCGRYDCVQIAYSALDRRPEARVLPAALEHDIGIVVRSVLLKGVLTHRAQHLPAELAPLQAAAAQLTALAAAAGLSLPELAYRYVLAHPAAHTALVGTARVEELEAGVGYAAPGPLADDLLAQVRAVEIADDTYLNPGNWPQ